ncbi:hypothetical protein ACNOYE_29220 [Nannocystaceae bacterium ST9]
MAAASCAAFCLLSSPALAGPPELPVEPVPVLPAEPAPSEPAPAPSEEALRIVEGPAPAPALAPAPEPTIATAVPAPIVEPTPTPACGPEARPYIPKRPVTGTGLLVGGAATLGLASILVVLATVGRNEVGVSSREALPIGLSALPVGGVGVAMLMSGMKANKRYTAWVADNHLDAPASGNGLLVSGLMLGAAGAISLGLAIDHNRKVDAPDLGDRTITGLSAATLASGVMLLGGGGVQRAHFSAWEGVGYVRPGFYAGRGGVGLTISGRF